MENKTPNKTPGKPRMFDLHWRISALFVAFGILLAVGVTVSVGFGQVMITHPVWEQILRSTTQHYIAGSTGNTPVSLPTQGAYKGWHVKSGTAPPADMPHYLATLPAGFYSEQDLDRFDEHDYAALVTPVADGRVVTVIDMTDIEQLQNKVGIGGLIFVLVNLALVGATLLWLHGSLRKPARALAQRMEALDPEQPSLRLSVDYPQAELHDIAVQANRHLERVERFIERERSLLDQASHEFRTPVAVISGAVDVLVKQALPAQAQGPLARIRGTVDNLTETMGALLYLSREPEENERVESTRVDLLLQELMQDHEHLLAFKPARFVLVECVSFSVQAPEAMVGIVIANLLRNAAENTQTGDVTVSLTPQRLRVTDSGEGFDPVEAARSYSAALQTSMKPGGGRGLGLFLTKRICERFKWSLAISSAVNKGSVVDVRF
ncbi:sensor histidine kinase [Polaromonas sp. YR568]|uniref:sensor histidine kinase n=1 Tax=Polaromonas sp. YR568 TaxID=1855301 RepID=UPI00398BE3B8